MEEVEKNEPHKIIFDMIGEISGEIVIGVSEVDDGAEIRYTGRYNL